MRRQLLSRRRPPLAIERTSWRLRTFHGGRAWLLDGVRQPFTLDRVVFITLPRMRWLEGGAA